MPELMLIVSTVESELKLSTHTMNSGIRLTVSTVESALKVDSKYRGI